MLQYDCAVAQYLAAPTIAEQSADRGARRVPRRAAGKPPVPELAGAAHPITTTRADGRERADLAGAPPREQVQQSSDLRPADNGGAVQAGAQRNQGADSLE